MQKSLDEYMRLYLVLETGSVSLPLGDFIMQVIEGGVTAIQLRDKTQSAIKRYETAKQIASLVSGRDVLFIINNTVDIALAVGAHGVHVGQEDLPVEAVKKMFPSLICGTSCNSTSDVDKALAYKADYVGIGPVFFTPTKSDLRPVLGVEGAKTLVQLCELPSVAIGGINLENVQNLNNSKFSGVAVSSALCQSKQPYDDALILRKKFDSTAW